jgi:hypothetical protein
MDRKQLSREEILSAETGYAEISPTMAKLFSLIFAVMIVTVLVTHVIQHCETVGSIFPAIGATFKTNSPQEFNDSLRKELHDYEEAINETTPVREAVMKMYKRALSFGKQH